MRLRDDPGFRRDLDSLLSTYVGRPTPLHLTRRFGAAAGAGHARVYLKREDLCHTGSHKLNNALGQALLARATGRARLIAETGAGQHGVAVATAAALVGLPCTVYMGERDVERQRANVQRMQLLGARLAVVRTGSRTLKDATSEAIRDWMGSYADTHYAIGSVVGPHPYPTMVRDFQRVIGIETKAQVAELEARAPDVVVACVGGGSNAMGIFHPFLEDAVRLVGVEAGGTGETAGSHSAALGRGRPGALHGAYSYLLQDEDGQIQPTHSIAAGLDYPGVGPEHASLRDSGRAEYVSVSDHEAHAAYELLARTEGIIPAFESSHALAHLSALAPEIPPGTVVVICLSGRGDKDVGRDLQPTEDRAR